MTRIEHIFVDLDDVLCDLVGAVLREIGLRDFRYRDWPEGEWDIPKALGLSEDEVWGEIRSLGENFWHELEPTDGAHRLISEIRILGVPYTILSSPRIGGECAAGKVKWIEESSLCEGPLYSGFILTAEKHLLAAPGRVLIDDCSANCDAWEAAGGTAIVFPRRWNRQHANDGNCLQYTLDALAFLCEYKSDGDAAEESHDGAIRKFATGATRNSDEGKLDFEGFFSPLSLERLAKYMHHHRRLEDGSLRDSDNWQQGIPLDTYIKSAWRHFFAWWKLHRERAVHDERDGHEVTIDEAICGVLFNAQGYLHETLKQKETG